MSPIPKNKCFENKLLVVLIIMCSQSLKRKILKIWTTMWISNIRPKPSERKTQRNIKLFKARAENDKHIKVITYSYPFRTIINPRKSDEPKKLTHFRVNLYEKSFRVWIVCSAKTSAARPATDQFVNRNYGSKFARMPWALSERSQIKRRYERAANYGSLPDANYGDGDFICWQITKWRRFYLRRANLLTTAVRVPLSVNCKRQYRIWNVVVCRSTCEVHRENIFARIFNSRHCII